jgi:hypothetical protein
MRNEFAEEFAGGGVDDADVQVLDEEQDVGSGLGSGVNRSKCAPCVSAPF